MQPIPLTFDATAGEFERGSGRSSRRLVGAAAAAFCAAVVLRAWVCDDAYILFRVVDNCLHGYGLTWNVAERVQPHTHALWTLAQIPLVALTGNPFLSSLALSFACTLGTITVLLRAFRGRERALALGLFLPLTLSRSVVDYSTAGLEGALSFLLLACFVAVWLRPGPTPWFRLSLLAALATTNRTDLAVLFAPALLLRVVTCWSSVRWSALLAGTLPFVAWEVFSVVYYGFPFPNTMYAKLDTGLSAESYLRQGLLYARDLAWRDLPSALLLLCGLVAGLALCIPARRRVRPWAASLGLLAPGLALYVAYVLRVGGDAMSGRFFSVPIFCAGLLTAAWLAESREPRVARAAVLAFCLAFGIEHTLLPSTVKENGFSRIVSGIADEHRVLAQHNTLIDWQNGRVRTNVSESPLSKLGTDVAARVALGESHVRPFRMVGMFGYYAGPNVHIVDQLALCDPLLARLPMTPAERWRIGHFNRDLPEGYLAVLAGAQERLEHPELARYYEQLQLVTRGPLFTRVRWSAIAGFALGRYRPWRDAYVRDSVE